MDDMAVGQLVKAAAAGDQRSWDALVERFAGLVWAVARSFRLDDADARDVSQVTWLRLVEHLDRITDPDRVGAWLATTARRECLRLVRTAGRTVPASDSVELDRPAADELPHDHRLIAGEREAAVWKALAAVSERCQTLLRLLMADPPPSYEEVSAALGMPVGSIGPTRARCLDRVRREIERSGITEAGSGSVS